MIKRAKVFISYSWDGQEHQDWVLQLARDLMTKFGVDVLLDQFELSAGKDLTHFMETAITQSDKVLVILTPNYKIKAENRNKGVGFETSIISQEIFASPISKIKFIPILREGSEVTSAPTHLKSKLYHFMTKDSDYITKLYELSKIIYDKPLIEKPQLGNVPDFENNIHTDPLLDIARELESKEKLNKELNRLLESSEGAKMFFEEIQTLFTLMKEKAEFYSENTYLDFKIMTNENDYIIINCMGFAAKFSIISAASNTTKFNEIELSFFKGYINNPRAYTFREDEPKRIKLQSLKFDFDQSKNIIWKSSEQIYTTVSLSQEIFAKLVQFHSEDKTKSFR